MVSKRKTWVLHTETKGTGAEMVPIEKTLGDSGSGGAIVVKPPKPRPQKAPEPFGPRKFKVVDVMTKKVLAEGANARTTVELLEGVRSIVDVSIYVQEKDGSWRRLSQREGRTLWGLRGRRPSER